MPPRHSPEPLSQQAVPAHRESTLLEELRIERQRGTSLVQQIIVKLQTMVESGRLKAGTKTPSVRELAKALGVSTFTVTEAYDTLVSKRILNSRPGAGYFVTSHVAHTPARSGAFVDGMHAGAESWLPVLGWDQNPDLLPVGSGSLPPEWCSESMMLQALRQATKMPAERLVGYGHPLGFQRLRELLARGFSERFCAVSTDQIVLTNGVSHALDLVVRTLLKAGDTVLVEDPGYFNFHRSLRHYGIKVIGVPRTQEGLDVEAFAALAAKHRPTAAFINTVLQNPLSTTLTLGQAHRIIALAEQYDFWIVEDDIFRDLGMSSDASLTSLDGLNRVICVGGFSKTIAPSLRVGYVLCPTRLVRDLVSTKMTYGLTTSELNERCVLEVLSDSSHRRYIDRLRLRLGNDRERFLEGLAQVGMAPLATPRGGLFLSAGWRVPPSPEFNDAIVSDAALKAGIALARGEMFSITPVPGFVWFRFNVAYCNTPHLHTFLHDMSTRVRSVR